MEYNLELRTKDFSKAILNFLKTLRKDELNRNLISQIARSATSIGANYHEANGASSRNDFRNKIFICRKEAQETSYWLELIEEINPDKKHPISVLKDEIFQLIKIFGKISASLNK